jgi:hypothetical protein
MARVKIRHIRVLLQAAYWKCICHKNGRLTKSIYCHSLKAFDIYQYDLKDILSKQFSVPFNGINLVRLFPCIFKGNVSLIPKVLTGCLSQSSGSGSENAAL